MRKIIHIDMDAFFASVEQRDHPHLRGKPVAVGGSSKRGVVAAASYEARPFGVRSAMPSSRAKQLCPQLIFVKSRFDVYRQVSHQIRNIFKEYTDLIEPLSLDEAYLDVTENKKAIPSATWVATSIRAQIQAKTRLTASAGVAPNKFVAKIASDVNKPNGICVIPPSKVEAFLQQLPIGKFHGVGKVTEASMHRLGIFTGKDLKAFPKEELIRHFGKSGVFYYQIARGLDERPVEPNSIRKSFGVEETFEENLIRPNDILIALESLSKELERRMSKSDSAGKTVSIKVRYPNFITVTRAHSKQIFLNRWEDFYKIAKHLIQETEAKKHGVRLLGISVSNLKHVVEHNDHLQLMLPFGESVF